MTDPAHQTTYLNERAKQAGQSEHLGSGIDRTVLSGLQPGSYRCFIERTWRSMTANGVVSLIHPESHFTEARASTLRQECYHRLRRHWQFYNQFRVFAEIGNTRSFGVHVYGTPADIRFKQAAALYHPQVVTRSLRHDGDGPPPGMKDPDDNWDIRPHAERIIEVTDSELAGWAALIDEPGTPATKARMLYPVNRASAQVLEKIATAARPSSIGFQWTAGWHESADRKLGHFESASAVPTSWDDVILQGPHLTVATLIYQQGNPTMRSHKDYSLVDLESLPEDFIPRTNYQVTRPAVDYLAAYPQWDDKPSSSFYQLAWREMCDPATVRTLQSALLPPGPTHVHAVHSLTIGSDSRRLVVLAGVSHSLIADFMIKVIGNAHIKASTWLQLPCPIGHPLEDELVLRTLRLNCLVAPFADLWSSLYQESWQSDSWTPELGEQSTVALDDIAPTWNVRTPLRLAADRRRALIEIDAIVAVMLGITAEELLTIYRTQFPVLQRYEREARYDANGRQLPPQIASELRKDPTRGRTDITVDGRTYIAPFTGVDREYDIRLAHKRFSVINNVEH